MNNGLLAERMTAPALDNLILQAEHVHEVTDDLTKQLFFELFHIMNDIAISGDDELRELWLVAPRGSIEDFGDYEEYLAEGDVASRQEFEELWLDHYPESLKWYRLSTVRYQEYYSVFIDRKLVLQHLPEPKRQYPFEQTELMNWLLNAVNAAINLLKSGAYNDCVNLNLPFRQRIGKILRRDYWFIFPEANESYLADIEPDEIVRVADLINRQSEESHLFRMPEMSAARFLDACKFGYEANQYEGFESLSPRELYLRHADGRDDGLLDLDESSAAAFSAWYHDRTRGGGHPWEVCRGGNSTHISLFVKHDDNGWWFVLSGSSQVRSVETVKFYLRLSDQGLPVFLIDGKEILAMLKGEDFIGIVPQGVYTRYCDSFFPGEKMLTFMNLPWKKTDQLVKAAYWYPIENTRII